MKKLHKQSGFIALALAGILVLMLLSAGCTGTGGNATPPTPTTTTKTSITVTGSTTVLPVAQEAADDYMLIHPDANIQITGGGSGVGVQAAGEKTADIGMSSRDVKPDEMKKYPDLVAIPIGKDGLTMIVNPANPVNSLTAAQIKDIYTGNYTNWKQVGGSDMPIVVIGRDSASGTRDYFTSSIMGGANATRTMLEKNSNGAVTQTVAQTPGAIGYVGIGFVNEYVKALKIDINGTLYESTVDNVLSGTYPYSRYLYMLTSGQPTGLTKDYIDFILSPAGQEHLKTEGYVPLS
jgi:phosphate transport system substrate-binding protein